MPNIYIDQVAFGILKDVRDTMRIKYPDASYSSAVKEMIRRNDRLRITGKVEG